MIFKEAYLLDWRHDAFLCAVKDDDDDDDANYINQ